jgi:hypothetical protein
MSRLTSFQIRKLERRIEATGTAELKERLRTAQESANRKIASMARDPKAATSKRHRDALEAEITRIYASLSLDFDKWLGDIVRTGGPVWAGETAGQIMQATGKKLPLMRFDRERVQRYQEMINAQNGEHLAAVFTRSMTDASIRQLRSATVDTFRQQVIEGWTANETHKRLQQAWDRQTGNESGRRFVDRGGNEWTNSRYLQMLTRTTMQRVSREVEIDTLADNGFSLARISSDAGDPCPICEAWQGVIIRVAGSGEGGGRFPTYQQSLDAGMWHPNCTHRLEYIDEDLEADEIKRQAEQPSPGAWEDPDAVRAYSDGINQKRYRDGGMSAAEARRAVMRDRLKDRARSGMVSERFDEAIDAIPDNVLDQMRLDQLPHFRLAKKGEEPAFSRNSPKGGWVVLDRAGAGKAEFDKGFYSLQTKRGVDVTAKAVAVAEKPKANPVLDAYKEAAKQAGFSDALLARIDAIPEQVLKLMPDLPPLVDSKTEKGSNKNKAFYRPSEHKVYMNTDPLNWYGAPSVFDHEIAHAIHTKTGVIKDGVIDEGLRKAIEADYDAFKKTAKEKHGGGWKSEYDRNSLTHKQEIAKALGVENYYTANIDLRQRVIGMRDSLGGISKGALGEGHPVSYYKKLDGVQGYKEVYANGYRAAINNWTEYDEMMPLTMKWIRSSIGL